MAYFAPNSAQILDPPSPSDRAGAFYAFFDPTFSTAKYGRSNNPPRRKGEWERQCRGEIQVWLPFYWEVPFAAKFERLIHQHYRRAGYWLGPMRCAYCGVKHREKYRADAGLIVVVEHYLGVLGWPVIRVNGDDGRAARKVLGQNADVLQRQGTVRGSERVKRRAETLRTVLDYDIKSRTSLERPPGPYYDPPTALQMIRGLDLKSLKTLSFGFSFGLSRN
ncbi:hypothetical protein B0H11DRAFT_1928657 [Mycena galericulata]|nr:hypothetical protein B0H11DRAFT_1928657 [Mycena galericulata]